MKFASAKYIGTGRCDYWPALFFSTYVVYHFNRLITNYGLKNILPLRMELVERNYLGKLNTSVFLSVPLLP